MEELSQIISEGGIIRTYFCYTCKIETIHNLKYGEDADSSEWGFYWRCSICHRCLNAAGGDEYCLKLLERANER